METSLLPTEEQRKRIEKYLLTYSKNFTEYSTHGGGKGLEVPICEFIDGCEKSIFLYCEHDMKTDKLTHRFSRFSNEQRKGLAFRLSSIRKPSLRRILAGIIYQQMKIA